jgi:hypothetical protein
MVTYSERTEVKVLNPQSMNCEAKGCKKPAGYLFRTGDGPIQAYCERHADESAKRFGINLPECSERVLRAGWNW